MRDADGRGKLYIEEGAWRIGSPNARWVPLGDVDTKLSGAIEAYLQSLTPAIARQLLAGSLMLLSCQDSCEDRGRDVAELMDVLVNASQGQAESLIELDQLLSRRLEDLSVEEVERLLFVGNQVGVLDYPSQEDAAIAARRDLLVAFAVDVMESALDRLQECDLTTYEGLCRGYFAMRLLEEVTGGTFGWDPEVDSLASVRRNELRVKSWQALLEEWRDSGRKNFTSYHGTPNELGLPFVEVRPAMAFGGVLRVGLPEDQYVEVRAGLGHERFVRWGGDGEVCEVALVLLSGYSLAEPYVGLASHGGAIWEECAGVRRIVLSEGWEAPGEGADAAKPRIEADIQDMTLSIVIRSSDSG